MKTNFFEQIAAIGAKGTFKLAITIGEGNAIIVSEIFTATCGDKAVNHITPLSLSGTAAELDEAFFERITVPVQQVAGLMVNMEAHLKSVETARLASKMAQDKKAKQKQPAAGTSKGDTDHELPEHNEKAEKKKAYDEAVKRIEALNADCKYEEALGLLPAATDYPDKGGEIEKLRSDLTRKAEQYKQISLFS